MQVVWGILLLTFLYDLMNRHNNNPRQEVESKSNHRADSSSDFEISSHQSYDKRRGAEQYSRNRQEEQYATPPIENEATITEDKVYEILKF